VRAARLQAIKAEIMASLRSDTLSIAAIAARHGISPRYVHMLFESEGTTFSEFVLGHRLASAHRMLRDPRYLSHSITAIAFACGFVDLSHSAARSADSMALRLRTYARRRCGAAERIVA
jgi:AraC-like DNA-binding protein